jgi:hypothetical protein
MAIMLQTVTMLRNFINRAEVIWFTVFDSKENGRVIIINGDEYQQLPVRFNTHSKIIAFFRRFWSPRLSLIMLCNLRPLRFRGKLYLPVGDPGTVPFRVVSLKVLSRTAARIRVSAVLEGSETGNETIIYTFTQINRRLTIIARTKRADDYRYARCRL